VDVAVPRGRRDGPPRELSLVINAAALIGAKVAGMGLGFVFWVLAARLAPAPVVGTAAAAVSAMVLCTQAGGLGAGSAIILALPAERSAPGRVVASGLALAGLGAVTAGLVALGVAAVALDNLDVVARDPLFAVAFVLAAVLGTLGVVVDQTQTALGRGDQAFTRGIVFGAATIVVLVGAAGLGAGDTPLSVFSPWVAAGVIATAVGALQLRRVLRTRGGRFQPSGAGMLALVRVGLPNQALTLAERAPGLILPVLVAELVSPAANAAWYAAWMMAWVVLSVPVQTGISLFAELAKRPQAIKEAVTRGLRMAIGLGLAGAAVAALLAHPLLRLLGEHYASEGAAPLRILLLGLVPFSLTTTYFAATRTFGRLREGLTVGWIAAVLAVVLPAWAGAAGGLVAMAATWTLTYLGIGIVAGVRLRRLVRDHAGR
jgi:O-antigen/teichoic acid export membrane protein